jgi:DNA primase
MILINLAQQKGLNPKFVAHTAGGEYHSSCPSCGGTDRFVMQPNKQMKNCIGCYFCRRCEVRGDTIEFARSFLNYPYPEAKLVAGASASEINIDSILKTPKNSATTLVRPSVAWIKNANELVSKANEKLLNSKGPLKLLANRGLPLEAIVRYKLGWSDKDLYSPRSNWGLDENPRRDNKSNTLWMPSGFVIPTIDTDGSVIRLKVRRDNFFPGDKFPKYVAIPGSMNGLNKIGPVNRSVMVVVESELDAYAIDYAMGDLVCAVAVGSNIKNPDNVVDRIAKIVKHILICHDNDQAGLKMLKKWETLYAHAFACPTPQGKDIGEFVQNGGNIRSLILKTLKD